MPVDPTTYPILTEEVSFPTPTPAPAAPGLPGAAPLGRIVDGAIRDVLNWRVRAGDSKGFMAALTASFATAEVEGHTEITWTPRSPAAQLGPDMGAVTGAQASIYARARVIQDQALPLLSGFVPLKVDADLEDVAAITAIIQSEIQEIVAELAFEGGPRVERVDQLFLQLGAVSTPRGVDDVDGNLARLRERLGMFASLVNTLDEERNYTNFIIFVDYLNSLRFSWEELRAYFIFGVNGKTEAFLGTQLILMSRALDVIAESVQTVNFVMDSVFLGPAERQTLPLNMGRESQLYVADLLSWVERFATEEGKLLLQDAGKDGVAVGFRPTLSRLVDLVGKARATPDGLQDPSGSLPKGYFTDRVQNEIGELYDELLAALKLAERIRPGEGKVPTPVVTSVEPTSFTINAAKPQPLAIVVHGQHFQQRAAVRLQLQPTTTTAGPPPEILPTSTVVESQNDRIYAFFAHNLTPGTWSVVVTNPGGDPSNTDKTITVS